MSRNIRFGRGAPFYSLLTDVGTVAISPMLCCSIGQAIATLSSGPTDQVHERSPAAVVPMQATLTKAGIDGIDDDISARSGA